MDNNETNELATIQHEPSCLSEDLVCANISAVDAVSDQGPKNFNEDEFVGVPVSEFSEKETAPGAFFGVYDGHGGNSASIYAKENLHHLMFENEKFADDPKSALCEAISATCENFRKDFPSEKKVGTTAVCTLITEKKVICGWVGDSEAWLFKNKGQPVKLMESHQPLRFDERRRIERDGGLVTKESCSKPQVKSGIIGRVNGNLAVSRAIGDETLKPWVLSEAEITETELDGSEEFLVLGSDGLWDVLSPKQVSKIIRQYMNKRLSRKGKVDPSEGISKFVTNKVKKISNADNITVVVVFFKNYVPVREDLEESSTEASSSDELNLLGPKKIFHWLLQRVRE